MVIATPEAYAIVRYRFPGRSLVRQALIIPLIVPTIMLGFGLMLLFKALDIELSLVTILIGHATYVLPFAFFVIAAQQYGFDRTLGRGGHGPGRRPPAHLPVGDAAPHGPRAGGGGNPRLHALARRVHHHVPVDEHDADTLPLYVWGMLRTIVSPTVNAVATLIVIASRSR